MDKIKSEWRKSRGKIVVLHAEIASCERSLKAEKEGLVAAIGSASSLEARLNEALASLMAKDSEMEELRRELAAARRGLLQRLLGI